MIARYGAESEDSTTSGVEHAPTGSFTGRVPHITDRRTPDHTRAIATCPAFHPKATRPCSAEGARPTSKKSLGAMTHVLLVEADDEICLSLWQVSVTAGCRVTITDSIAGGQTAVRDEPNLSFVVTDAELPADGLGELMAAIAGEARLPCLMLRRFIDVVQVSNVTGPIFEGAEIEAIDFIGQTLRAEAGSMVVSLSCERKA